MELAHKETLDLLNANGFQFIRRTGDGHEMWKLGEETVTVGGRVISDLRSWKNARAEVRRAIRRHQEKKKAGVVVEESTEEPKASLGDRLLMIANEVEVLEKSGLQDKIDMLEEQLNEFATDLDKAEQTIKRVTEERDEARRAHEQSESLLERSTQENNELRNLARSLAEKNAHLKEALRNLLVAEGKTSEEISVSAEPAVAEEVVAHP